MKLDQMSLNTSMFYLPSVTINTLLAFVVVTNVTVDDVHCRLGFQVEYDVLGFLDKNRDTFPPSIQMLMKSKLRKYTLCRTISSYCYNIGVKFRPSDSLLVDLYGYKNYV